MRTAGFYCPDEGRPQGEPQAPSTGALLVRGDTRDRADRPECPRSTRILPQRGAERGRLPLSDQPAKNPAPQAHSAPPPDSVRMVGRCRGGGEAQQRLARIVSPGAHIGHARAGPERRWCARESGPANQLSDTRCCLLNTGDCGTQSGFSKSPPLACWYLPREDEGRPNAGGIRPKDRRRKSPAAAEM